MNVNIREVTDRMTNVTVNEELIISIDEEYEQVLVYEPHTPAPVEKIDISEA